MILRLIQTTVLVIAIGLLASPITRAQDAATKPKLSEEIERVLQEDGAEAARNRFDEIFPAKKDDYEVDADAIAGLGSKYMQEGDMQTGMMYMQMMGAISAEMIKSAGAINDMETATVTESPSEEETAPPPPEPKADRGPVRTDLARFAGFYGIPDQAEKNRMLFVTESCDGYLVAGAVWGDAQNWWMKSEGDSRFSYTSQYTNFTMEFELDADGNATTMIHDLDFMPSPLPKHGPLPEEWRACIRPEGG